MDIELLFEPRDLWIGLFWDWRPCKYLCKDSLNIWICIIPMFPIHIAF